MHRPTIDAPLFEFGEFFQQSFMSGLILWAMALGAMGYTLVTGRGQGGDCLLPLPQDACWEVLLLPGCSPHEVQ